MMWCVEDIKIVVLYINLQELGVLFTTALNVDPKFVEAWRCRMVLGTISDEYDMTIDSANKIIELRQDDPHALTIKAFYCKALRRDGFAESMALLKDSFPEIAAAAEKHPLPSKEPKG